MKLLQKIFPSLFSPKPIKEDTGKTQPFTFIWYKKMVDGNRTHYTAPFRTTVHAKTKAEAMDKLTNFALNKMVLKMIEEKDFNGDELMQFQKQFNHLNKMFEQKLNKIFK